MVNSASIHFCSKASEGKIVHDHRKCLAVLVFIRIIVTNEALTLYFLEPGKFALELFFLVIVQLGKRENFHCPKLIRYLIVCYKNRTMGASAQMVHKFIGSYQRVAGHGV